MHTWLVVHQELITPLLLHAATNDQDMNTISGAPKPHESSAAAATGVFQDTFARPTGSSDSEADSSAAAATGVALNTSARPTGSSDTAGGSHAVGWSRKADTSAQPESAQSQGDDSSVSSMLP